MGGVNRRSIEVGSDTCLLGFSGRDYIKSAVFDATTLAPVGAVNEVQTVAITGVPTGGTFKLKYRGQTTATIAFNATAAAVQAALEALSTIGTGNVLGAGGALPATPVTITFQGQLAGQDVFALTADATGLTGGTAPAVVITETTKGVSNDPRYLVGSADKPGVIVTKTGTTPNRVKEYTGTGSIWGVVDGVHEFMGNTRTADRDIQVYYMNCVFNTNKIKNYATYSAALITWAGTSFSKLEAV